MADDLLFVDALSFPLLLYKNINKAFNLYEALV